MAYRWYRNHELRRPIAIIGAWCLGTWKRAADHTYKLNHFAAAWDPTGSNLAVLRKYPGRGDLGSNENQFTGTFTIDNYTEADNSFAHIQGVITGTRITVDTPSQSIF
jgi:hypothetical protein